MERLGELVSCLSDNKYKKIEESRRQVDIRRKKGRYKKRYKKNNEERRMIENGKSY